MHHTRTTSTLLVACLLATSCAPDEEVASGGAPLVVHGVTIPECAAVAPLTGQPFDLSAPGFVLMPLGELGSGGGGAGHIFPTQHMHGPTMVDANGYYSPVTVLSPGDVVLRAIVRHTTFDGIESMKLILAVCEDVYLYVEHVTSLHPDLARAITSYPVNEYVVGDVTILDLAVPLVAGQELGVSYSTHAVDLGAIDFKVVNPYVDPTRYAVDAAALLAQIPISPSGMDLTLAALLPPQRVHAVCPFDYFSPDARALAFQFNPRSVPPECGDIVQDVAGTLAGSWFGNADSFMSTLGVDFEEQAITFGHDSVSPNLPVIAAGEGLLGASGQGLALGTYGPAAFAWTPFASVSQLGQYVCYRDLVELTSNAATGLDMRVRLLRPSQGKAQLLVQVMAASACTAPAIASHIYQR